MLTISSHSVQKVKVVFKLCCELVNFCPSPYAIHAAIVAVVLVLYLWRTSLRVAKHTYRYSSARVRQLRMSGHSLWYQKHLRGAVLASRRVWAYAKSAGYLDGMCSVSQWKRRLRHISGVDFAVSHLGCRHRYGKSEQRNSALGRSTPAGNHFQRKLISRKSVPCLNGNWPQMKRSVSWGELVHLNDERCSTVLKQYNHRVSSVGCFVFMTQ